MEEINPWITIESHKIYENNWIGLTEHQVINPSGGKGIYGEVHFKNYAIGILPLDGELNTWLVGQYRFPLKAYSWEIPEGGGPLESDHLSNSVSNELAIIYIAKGLSQGEAAPEETEELSIRKLPFEEAYQMVVNGQITDSMSVAALLRAKILLQEGHL
jgi:hypothetical protein